MAYLPDYFQCFVLYVDEILGECRARETHSDLKTWVHPGLLGIHPQSRLEGRHMTSGTEKLEDYSPFQVRTMIGLIMMVGENV